MKRIVLSLAVMGLCAPAWADTRTVTDLEDFTQVKLSGSMDADIQVGGSSRVEIEAEGKRLRNIEVKVHDGVLYVKERNGRGYWGGGDVQVNITTPALDYISLSGSGDVDASGIDAGAFTLKISGSGDAELDGACETLKVAVSGSGDVSASGLECADAEISISGSGDVEVHASHQVAVKVSGSGDVDIYGGGRLTNSKISGSGDLTMHSED